VVTRDPTQHYLEKDIRSIIFFWYTLSFLLNREITLLWIVAPCSLVDRYQPPEESTVLVFYPDRRFLEIVAAYY
jgi:hypothetical protein